MSRIKSFILLIVGAIFLYSALMIIIRLKITELGYEFEEAKNDERALQEEQLKLRAILAHQVSTHQLKAKLENLGFSEPEPRQIVVIP